MKTLVVPFLRGISYDSATDENVNAALEAVKSQTVGEVPWAEYPYKPTVYFKVAHTSDSIVLKFMVEERHIKATYRNTNDPVYRDSCVEFFISFDGTHYYNLEFNCVGTGKIGYGDENKEQRRDLPDNLVETVKVQSTINPGSTAKHHTGWHLLLNIPLGIFYADEIGSLSNIAAKGNFYKCGDDLPEPHFLSWNRINHPSPNFHLPSFFGKLIFASD